MSLDNFIHIIGGKLLNSPDISSFNSIQKDISHISQGDLFVAYNHSDIKKAIENGAYAVLLEHESEIIDDEIAWIYVENLDRSIIKLIRYRLLKSKMEFFYLQNIEFEIARSTNKDEKLLFLLDDLFKSYKELTNNNHKIDLVISKNRALLNDIYPNYQTINKSQDHIKIISKTIFTTTLVYKSFYFEQINIPSLFIVELNRILHLFDDKNIRYDLSKLDLNSHFCPIFLSKKLKQKNFGKSQRVLICEEDQHLIEKEEKYLKKEAPWAKIKVIDTKIDDYFTQNLYEDSKKYHFILILENCSSAKEYLSQDTNISDKNLFN